MNLLERIANDPVPYAHRIILWAVALLLLFFIFGCASQERYLSAEEDASFKEHCESDGPCMVLKRSQWEQLENLLKRCGARGV